MKGSLQREGFLSGRDPGIPRSDSQSSVLGPGLRQTPNDTLGSVQRMGETPSLRRRNFILIIEVVILRSGPTTLQLVLFTPLLCTYSHVL